MHRQFQIIALDYTRRQINMYRMFRRLLSQFSTDFDEILQDLLQDQRSKTVFQSRGDYHEIFLKKNIIYVAGCVYDGLEWLLLWPMSRLFG